MSQVSGLAGDGPSVQSKASNTGRAVMLLAMAVILGVALLHELDNSPTGQTASSAAPAAETEAITPAPTTTLLARSPAEVKVLVANGVGVAGAASKVAGRLQPVGYQLLKPGNTINKEVNSLVQYAPGYQAEAQQVATSLGIPPAAVQAMPVPAPVQDLQAANVLVILGNDLANAAVATTTIPGQAPTVSSTTVNPATGGPLNRTETTQTTAVGGPQR